MTKDAYYFPHDSNARNDQRLMKVRMKYGMKGYGIYFGIIEILREQCEYTLTFNDIESISFDLRVDAETIEDIIQNYNLFVIEGHTMFYSKSLKKRLECMDEKKRKRQEAGRKGGKVSSNAQAMLKQKTSNAQALDYTRQNKTRFKETKQNNIKERDSKFKKQVFEFANQYDNNLLNDFYSYWSEPNKSNTKMLCELKRTFHIGRRLATWERNNFGNNKKVKKKHNYKQPDGKNYLAWCSVCLCSSFYDPYNFNPDSIESTCCNAPIIDENMRNQRRANA